MEKRKSIGLLLPTRGIVMKNPDTPNVDLLFELAEEAEEALEYVACRNCLKKRDASPVTYFAQERERISSRPGFPDENLPRRHICNQTCILFLLELFSRSVVPGSGFFVPQNYTLASF